MRDLLRRLCSNTLIVVVLSSIALTSCSKSADSSVRSAASLRNPDPAMCANDAAQRGASIARTKVPDSLSFDDRRSERFQYIEESRWILFDADHDGRLYFNEYWNSDWATYLLDVPDGQCWLTKRQFMMFWLGDPKDAGSGWRTQSIVRAIEMLFADMDAGKKGYIDKADTRSQSWSGFNYSDREHKGYLVRSDLGLNR
jgi:hypothetical protein